MSAEQPPFKVGDRVVMRQLGPDQPEGVVTCINGLKTYPWLYTVQVTFESGKAINVSPVSLRPASEKWSLPATLGRQPELMVQNPEPATPPSPILVPDWEDEDLSEAGLARAVSDWEKSVHYIESGYDYREDIEEYQLDIFNRECVHAILFGLAHKKTPVPENLTARIATADQRFVKLTEESHSIWGCWDYDPTAFWYYFRWPRRGKTIP